MSQWGDKTVCELAFFIQKEFPELKGFNRRGLYRMRQFFETYKDTTIVSSSRTQIQDSNNQLNAIVSSSMTQLHK